MSCSSILILTEEIVLETLDEEPDILTNQICLD